MPKPYLIVNVKFGPENGLSICEHSHWIRGTNGCNDCINRIIDKKASQALIIVKDGKLEINE